MDILYNTDRLLYEIHIIYFVNFYPFQAYYYFYLEFVSGNLDEGENMKMLIKIQLDVCV